MAEDALPAEVLVRSGSARETAAVGAALAEVVEPGDVVLLCGPLGAGKTTLVKGLVAALGDEEPVTSPTFTLMRTYSTRPPVAHVDCWRLSDPSEVADLGIEDHLDEGGVAVVEWGEIAAGLIGRDALSVELRPAEDGDPDARELRLRASGPSSAERLGRLAARLASTGAHRR